MWQDIQSGNCFVHNTLMLDYPQKSVVRAKWRFYPTTHPWSPHHYNLEALGKALMIFFSAPSVLKLLPAGVAALLG